MDQGGIQHTIDQVLEVQAEHPNLELVLSGTGQLRLVGAVGFSIRCHGKLIEDEYQVELLLPEDFPDSPPIVFERSGKISAGFGHFMAAGNLCLEAVVEVRRKFAQDRSLLTFINTQVIPYLLSYSYLRVYGELPFGDRTHGATGLLEYYKEFFQTPGIATLKLLKCLADDFAPPLSQCPCGQGEKLKDCHGPKLDELRPHLPAAAFERQLEYLVQLALQAGIRLPERAVMPKRMWKKRRKSLGLS